MRAARCGNTNARIDAILGRFQRQPPVFLSDVTPRIRYVTVTDVIHATEEATRAECLDLTDQHDVRSLPITKEHGRLGGYFIPKVQNPREMRHVRTSIGSVVRALKATALHLRDEDSSEHLFVKIGAMDIRSFGLFAEREAIPSGQTIIVVGDRWHIQQRSIQMGVRLLVITGGLGVENEVVEQARERGLSVILSPHDSATTAWIIRTASHIHHMIDRKFPLVGPDERLSDFRRKVATDNVQVGFRPAEHGDAYEMPGIVSRNKQLLPFLTSILRSLRVEGALPAAG